MQKVTLNAQTRTEAGKGLARSLRREGSIPAVVYNTGKAESITLNHKEMITFINKTRGEKALITLKFSDGASKLALMKEYQVDPVVGNLLHADFMEIAMDEKVRVPIKLKLMGEPIGVKRDKGILERLLREVEVEALPANIPGHLELDVTELAAGHTMHVSDIQVPENVAIITDAGETVASVSLPKLQVEGEAAEGAEEGAAAPAEEKKEAAEEKKED